MARTYFEDFERDDGTDVTVEYTRSPYDPGVCSGPAENCYPPEGGEVEIIKAFTESHPDVKLTDAEYERMELWLMENATSGDDDYDDYYVERD